MTSARLLDPARPYQCRRCGRGACNDNRAGALRRGGPPAGVNMLPIGGTREGGAHKGFGLAMIGGTCTRPPRPHAVLLCWHAAKPPPLLLMLLLLLLLVLLLLGWTHGTPWPCAAPGCPCAALCCPFARLPPQTSGPTLSG